MEPAGCPLCDGPGGLLVWQGPLFRVIRAREAGYPAFWRLVWNAHVREFSDLPPADRSTCMEGVARIEAVVREHLSPDKVNLAALGNVVPHLHWHVIARFAWDDRFPAPVWAPVAREARTELLSSLEARLEAVDDALRRSLAAVDAGPGLA